jgi:hypothetical protein
MFGDEIRIPGDFGFPLLDLVLYIQPLDKVFQDLALNRYPCDAYYIWSYSAFTAGR